MASSHASWWIAVRAGGICLAAALGLALAVPALADHAPKTATDCDNLTPMPAVTACLQDVQEAADQALDDAYQAALKEIAGADYDDAATRQAWTAALEKAQALWTQYREADCRDTVPFEWGGGSGEGGGILHCLIHKAETRTAELKTRYPGN